MAALAVTLLTGQLSDRTTGQPLKDVHVSIAGATSSTDSRGRYRLIVPHPGTYTLTLQSADVPVERIRVTLTAGSNVRDVRACSTTLDYGCGEPAPAAAG